MSKPLVILFHDPKDDGPGLLNERLAARGCLPDDEHQVCSIVSLAKVDVIVCLDREPPPCAEECLGKAGERQMVYVWLHAGTQGGIKSGQRRLVQRTFGDRFREEGYSHKRGTPRYDALVHVLTEGCFSNESDPFSLSSAQVLKESIGRVKHRLARYFMALDTDIQGLLETARLRGDAGQPSGFDEHYWQEVHEAHRAVRWDERTRHLPRTLSAELPGDVAEKVRLLLEAELGRDNRLQDVVNFVNLLSENRAAEAWKDFGRYGRNPVHEMLEAADSVLDSVLQKSQEGGAAKD
jgi:hypothetical protein